MPIYDQGYRRYEARGPLHRIRFWPITREALRLILARRAFLGLLAPPLGVFLFYVGRAYVVTRFPEVGRVLPSDGRMFGEFLDIQVFFAVLLSIFGASGLVANDLRTGAILVYLSRPLTRRDYVLGKLGVPIALNLAVTLVPGLLLYGACLALAPEQFAKWELWWIGPAVVAHSIAASLVVSLVVLALSSLSRSARVAGLAFAGIYLGLDMVRAILQHGFNLKAAVLLSLQADLQALGVALFGVVDRQLDIFWGWPLLVLAVVALGCLAVLRSRVRAVEIVT
ncbi:MAG TPA: ABC transporter permease subunit [Vicinamibacteria bacterium]|nr:ABC transporter permease subunit [Vicinamibacteria bacterium]